MHDRRLFAFLVAFVAAVLAGPTPASAQSPRPRCDDPSVTPAARAAACTAVIAANPRAARAFAGRCAPRLRLGELEPAIEDCDRALEIEPRLVEAFEARGHAALRLGRLDDALFHYDEALKLAGTRAEARFGRGVVLRRKGAAGRGDAELAAARRARADIDAAMAGLGIAP